VSLAIDPVHLIVIAVGIWLGAWAAIRLRLELPRDGFAVLGMGISGAPYRRVALADAHAILALLAVAVALRHRAPSPRIA
jgi:hypothetical protein